MTVADELIPLRDELDDKLACVFAGKVVRKDLVRKVKVGANVPVFVLEYLLGKYCASSDELAIRMGLEVANGTLADNYIRPDESTKAQSLVKERGRHTFIDKVKVRLVDSHYWAEVTNFGHRHVHIPDRYVREFDRLLTGGIWAQIDMRFEYDEEERGKNPFWIETLTPIQLATFDLDEYRRLRAEFTTEEWLDLVIRSMGYEPSLMDRRLKLLFLIRLIPLCERNYNMIELGPRGTGKSYAVQELSPYTALLTGPTTVANLFGHMNGREKGMVMIWDVVGFDEVADLQKMPREVITTLKTYCESGQFQREHRHVRQHRPAGRRDGPDRAPVRSAAGRHPQRHGVHRSTPLLPARVGGAEDAQRALHRPLRLRRGLSGGGAA
jgi:ATP-dependent Lon protease